MTNAKRLDRLVQIQVELVALLTDILFCRGTPKARVFACFLMENADNQAAESIRTFIPCPSKNAHHHPPAQIFIAMPYLKIGSGK